MTDTQTNEYYQWRDARKYNPTDSDNYHVNVLDKDGDGYIFPAVLCFTMGVWEVMEEHHEVIEWLEKASLPSASPTTSDTFSLPHLKTAWNAFRMRGFPHNTDSYGNETFEQFISSLKHK